MAHTAQAAPFVLHRTRIGKGGMKKFGINFQRRRELFFIVTFHFSIGKFTMNAPRFWKLRKEYLTGIGLCTTMFGDRGKAET
jgi:hypothetical protein